MFQFTHPVRGATVLEYPYAGTQAGFNSRTPCGVRHILSYDWTPEEIVSIHAPRAGCDHIQLYHITILSSFNSRTPCGVRLTDGADDSRCYACFNSRTPCGVRRILTHTTMQTIKFQFTHPVRGATCKRYPLPKHPQCFNSRTPCGVRRHPYAYDHADDQFQFTHPVRGAT